MEWFKKHTDAVMIIGAILSSMIWMNAQFNELRQEITIIKTVLLIKGIMPMELASSQDGKQS